MGAVSGKRDNPTITGACGVVMIGEIITTGMTRKMMTGHAELAEVLLVLGGRAQGGIQRAVEKKCEDEEQDEVGERTHRKPGADGDAEAWTDQLQHRGADRDPDPVLQKARQRLAEDFSEQKIHRPHGGQHDLHCLVGLFRQHGPRR